MTPEDHIELDRFLSAIAAAEAGPTDAEIADAPGLDHWRPMLTLNGVPLLWGRVSHHPRLGDRLITTSPLVALDAEAGWARTYSRWYRLGVPFSTIARAIERDFAEGGNAIGVVGFELPGFEPVDDPDQLALLLARRIATIRQRARETRHH